MTRPPDLTTRPDASRAALTRRQALGGAAAAAGAAAPLLHAGPAAARSRHRARSPRGGAAGTDIIYIGAWLTPEVYAARFDSETAELTAMGPAAAVNSSWAVRHPRLPVLYVASGIGDGVAYSFAIDERTGALTQTSAISTGGTGTQGIISFISVDQASQTLLVANFASGMVLSLPIGEDGTLSTPVSSVQDVGSGPTARQDGPHPHCVVTDPTGRFVLVADFGADRVFVYPFDRRTRTISTAGAPAPYATPPGSGPRRLVWHPDGRTLYLMTELTATISTLEWDPRTGLLTQRQTQAADPPDFTGTRSAAELALSRDARFLYMSNRGENALQVYAVDPVTAIPALVQRTPCGGSVPWSFSIDPTGRWMFVANYASDRVNVFSIDRRTGLLDEHPASTTVPAPDGVVASCW